MRFRFVLAGVMAMAALQSPNSVNADAAMTLPSKVIATPSSSAHASLNAALIQAAYNGLQVEVEEDLAKGADVNARDAQRRTPLIALMTVDLIALPEVNEIGRMSQSDELDVAQVLVDHKADVNAQDDQGETALMQTCCAEDPDAAKFLLLHGADVNLSDDNGVTALMYAVRYDRYETCKALIMKGANVNAQTANGNTALLLAVAVNTDETEYGPDLIKFLLAHGANPNVKNKAGKTPLDYASRPGSEQILKMLLKFMTQQHKPRKA